MHENRLRDLVQFQMRKEILTLLKKKGKGRERIGEREMGEAHSALGVKQTHPALTGTACTIFSFPSLSR